MFAYLKSKRLLIVLGIFAIGIASGLLLSSRFNIMPEVRAEPKADVDFRTVFVKVADTVGPAVVSISSERVQRVPGGQRFYNFGPNGNNSPENEFFNDFLKNFFGEMPQREYKQVGLGSGVIIDADGYILTNDHVIGGAEKITVTMSDGRSFPAKLKGADPRSDLAIIKIDAKNIPYAELGNSDLVQTGEWVAAIGNPFGFAVNSPKPTVTVGVISAIHRSLPNIFGNSGAERSYLDLIQTDAAINPGNSGGPLCDLNGKVIGINVAIVSTTGGYQGVGFAIPSNVATGVIGDLIKGKKISYGWFGVVVQEVTDDLAKAFGLQQKQGALVSNVAKDGPAGKSGIKEGDIIIKIDNQAITNVRDVLKLVGAKKPGEKVSVALLRDKKEMTISVTVGERPTGEEQLQPEEEQKPQVAQEVIWRGIRVTDITPELAKRFGIDDTKGVIISNLDPDSPAVEVGLRRGDIIREINRAPVKNKADYNKVVALATGDVLIRTDKGYFIIKEPEKK